MNLPDIRTLVPHAGPMVLLDRVLEADAGRLVAEVRIHPRSLFFDAVQGGVGSWVGVEYMAQAIAAHAGFVARGQGQPVRVGFLLGARRYSAHAPLFADGVVLRVEVVQEMRAENGLGAFECRIATGEQQGSEVLASATLTVYQPGDIKEFMQGIARGSKE
jgi:predicted hotdog family 3-hydroxylacyl-ACP dehydratase